MADWYYYNESGERIGPIRGRQLKHLAQQGTITPETTVETIDENGEVRTSPARRVKGLIFSETVQPESIQNTFTDPFTIDRSMIQDSFSTPQSDQQPQYGTDSARHQTLENRSSNAKSPGIFDIRFTRFITNVWISIIWVVVIVAHFLGYGIAILVTITMVMNVASMVGVNSVFAGAIMLPSVVLLETVLFVLALIFSRMALEVIIVLFRIETNTRVLKERTEN